MTTKTQPTTITVVKTEHNGLHITLPRSVDQKRFLACLAMCSYNSARAVGMGVLHYVPGRIDLNTAMTAVDDGGINLDYVQGRLCKTKVRVLKNGVLEFDAWLFERDRGDAIGLVNSAVDAYNQAANTSLTVVK